MSIFASPAQIQVLELLRRLAAERQQRVCIVGGLVRDLLLGKSLHDRDIDFLIEGDGREFARVVQREIGGTLKVFDRFYTAKILNPRNLAGIDELDFASSRREQYIAPGALPKVELASLEEDLQRRDFTINAMALPVSDLCAACSKDGEISQQFVEHLYDRFQGKTDLKRRFIRVLHPKSFEDDPTRILRGFRYCARIRGQFENQTRELMLAAVAAKVWQTISKQRFWNEFIRVLQEEDSAGIFRALSADNVLADVEICTALFDEDFYESLEVLDRECPPGLISSKAKAGQYLVAKRFDPSTAEDMLVQHGLSRKRSKHLLSVANGKAWKEANAPAAEILFKLSIEKNSTRFEELQRQLAGATDKK